MTDKFEKTYAKTIFDYVLKHRCRNVSLPFNKIDGVEVYGYITAPTRVEAYRIYIYIYSVYTDHKLYNVLLQKHNNNTMEQVFDEFMVELHRLKTLKYDPADNRFFTHIDEDMTASMAVNKFFTTTDVTNYELKTRECCVCLELTRQRLPCDHYICLKCESSLKKHICPMCRKKYRRENSAECASDCQSENDTSSDEEHNSDSD